MRTVIVFTTSYHPFIGGAEVAIEEIAKRLKSSFRFIVITARQDRKLLKKEERPEGTIFRIGWGSRCDIWILAAFGGIVVWWKLRFGEWRQAYKEKKVLLFGVDISQGALAATVVSFLLPRVPFILNLQYGYGDLRIARGRGGAIRWALNWMLARADYVTAISRYLLDIARQYRYKGGAAVLPNGVAIEQFKNREEKKTHERSTVITVSRLVEKNGVDVLIRAIAEVQKKIPDIQCTIIGDGPEREKLLQQVRVLKLEEHILFLGSIPNGEVPAYLHRADVFVRASRSEGMGNVFVEALASGLPIIGTPVGGIPDIIENGKTGIFANGNDPMDFAEKIIQLLHNKSLSQAIVAEGQKMTRERFSWDGITRRYGDIFNTVGFPERRVVVATPLFPPDIGGPATYVETLVEELPQSGVGIAIAYFGEVRKLPKVIRHGAYFLKVFLKVRGKDSIFAQDPVSTGLPALLAAKLLRKKFVVKIVGDYAWEQLQNQEGVKEFIDPEKFQTMRFDGKTEARRKIERWVAGSADQVIVPSNYLKKIVKMWGVSPEKILVISNAFEVPETIISREQARRDHMLFGTILISAGRLVPWKGFELLIRIMPQVLKKTPDATLLIIGEGHDRERLAVLIRTWGLERSVKLLGSLPHVELLKYFRAGDLFLLNTGYEGMSHVLLEAMAMEIPIISTNVCGNPEVIENGVEGMLVDYNSEQGFLAAIDMMLSHKDVKEKIVERAKKKLEKFSRPQMIKNIKEILLQ